MNETLDTQGIADALGLTRDYVTDKVTKRPDFPAPVIVVSRRTKRWARADVLAWANPAAQQSQPA